MPINLLSRLRATLFFKVLIVSNLIAALGLLFFPNTFLSSAFSLVVHLLLSVTLVWFLVKIVWPIRANLDKLVLVVAKYKPEGHDEIGHGKRINMGSYLGILDSSIHLLISQHEELLSRSQQLENFSQVLEKQNQKINESRQRYRRTLDALENGLYLVDENYVVQAINRAEAAYFDAVPKELIGKNCHQVFRHRDTPCPDCMPREC
ncbi:MAG: hypothetical protein DRH03_11590, partial [Deltaproteobacteria bacterium]